MPHLPATFARVWSEAMYSRTPRAMNRRDWRTISLDDVGCDTRELENKLLPVLSNAARESLQSNWAEQMVHTCREHLAILLPFTSNETEFLNRLLDQGKIEPELLTEQAEMAARIQDHPLLNWKALNVRRHREHRQLCAHLRDQQNTCVEAMRFRIVRAGGYWSAQRPSREPTRRRAWPRTIREA